MPLSDVGMRERRHNPDGRRGRFAEKAPPGTRTKMLKIIYDRKADLQEKKRFRLIVRIVIAAFMLAAIFFGVRALTSSTYEAATSLYNALNVSSWTSVSQHP